MITAADPAEQGERLAGVAHDESGLGVGLAGLMQEFDRGHLLAAFALLEAVGEDDDPTVAPFEPGMEPEHQAGPNLGEAIGTERGAVKEVEQAAVAAGPQPQGAHEAGDAGQILPGAEGGEDQDEPAEGAAARTGRTQLLHRRPPVEPKAHRRS